MLVETLVEGGDWAALGDAAALAEAAARAALAEAGVAAEGREISLLLTDDAAIADLNRRFRGKDGPTNVLSWPAGEGAAPPGEPSPLGDIALAAETVAREAAERGLALRDHVAHLIVHGALHLLGYDHEEDDDAEAMERLERRALARIGVADPYE
ncbi:MAG: rRNA maturation RNase YbeY [Rhodobacteraceae bacterium]|nr:MAG: rRNA maturation RNase YbeY [Paracoccaceae bacterium]